LAISKVMSRLVVILPQSTKDKLEEIATAENRSMSNYVANLIEQHIREKALQ